MRTLQTTSKRFSILQFVNSIRENLQKLHKNQQSTAVNMTFKHIILRKIEIHINIIKENKGEANKGEANKGEALCFIFLISGHN